MRYVPLLLIVFSLVACMTQHDPQAEFLLFEDDYYKELYAWNPSAGVQAGFHQYDDDIEDLSALSHQKRIAAIKRLRSRLAEIPRDRLAAAQQIDHEFLEAQMAGELHELETLVRWRKNPMGYVTAPGNAVDLLMKRNFAPAQQRVRSAVARLRGIPPMIAAMKANIKDPPKEFVELAGRIAEGSVPFFRDDIGKWGSENAGLDVVLRSQFKETNDRAVAALEDAANWLKNGLGKHSTSSYAIGAENFSKKLLYDEMVDLPLAEVLAIGERNLERDYQAFLETARRIDPRKPPTKVAASLKDDHPQENDLLPFVRRNAESIRQFLIEKNIVTIPSEVRATITETPPYLRAGGFAYMDTPGAFEKVATEAFYYVTPTEPKWPAQQKEEHLRLFNRYVTDVVTIHEAYPGHYVQFLYAPQFPTKVRKLSFVGTNAEGWAHYSEQMMIEQGFGGGDPRFRLAQLSEALLRDCRYIAGIKLHTEGWTVEQATQLFMDKGFQERAIALEEARRGTYDPTYLMYTLGKLQIYKLRADYQAKLGSQYSLKKFHDAFLNQGVLPLKLLRKAMLGGDGGSSL